MKRYLLSLAVGAALATSASLALAQNKGVTIGTLECHEASGAGLIFTSSRNLNCTFSGTEKGAKAIRFSGKINRYGVDIGYQENGVILWAVVSTSTNFTPGDLAGKYGGVTAQAGWAAGLGANVLLGGTNQGFALQPLSVQGFNGINVAAGLMEVELSPR